jgi:hypothetical protein
MTALDISPYIDELIRLISRTVDGFGRSCCSSGAIVALVAIGAIIWMVKDRT